VSDWASANGRLVPGAKWYAEKLGWHVLPVHGIDGTGKCTCGKPHNDPKEIGKHPAAKRGQSDATTDIEQIDTWWGENENYNVGVFARPSGFFVIDIDPRSGGDISFDKLVERSMGELPPTVEAITGEYYDKGKVKRGRHLIYKCDSEEKFIGNLKAEGLNGIDIKHNGYILIAPSRHFSGVTYEWKPGHEPWNMEVAEASEELLSQKIHSLPAFPRFWFDALWKAETYHMGSYPSTPIHDEWHAGYFWPTHEIDDVYEHKSRSARYHTKLNGRDIADALRQICPSAKYCRKMIVNKRSSGYVLPDLSVAREEFETYLGGPIPWPKI
jgi:hypothetical protein